MSHRALVRCEVVQVGVVFESREPLRRLVCEHDLTARQLSYLAKFAAAFLVRDAFRLAGTVMLGSVPPGVSSSESLEALYSTDLRRAFRERNNNEIHHPLWNHTLRNHYLHRRMEQAL